MHNSGAPSQYLFFGGPERRAEERQRMETGGCSAAPALRRLIVALNVERPSLQRLLGVHGRHHQNQLLQRPLQHPPCVHPIHPTPPTRHSPAAPHPHWASGCASNQPQACCPECGEEFAWYRLWSATSRRKVALRTHPLTTTLSQPVCIPRHLLVHSNSPLSFWRRWG